ncbi:MAG: hypothetical protein LBF68_00710 [Christensenellaceae bacterium]|jgi:hypothetical protein|nr:hypothetical protein [Christensenellaceae bacterium]
MIIECIKITDAPKLKTFITLNKSECVKHYQKEFEYTKSQIIIPGFRKGKVPFQFCMDPERLRSTAEFICVDILQNQIGIIMNDINTESSKIIHGENQYEFLKVDPLNDVHLPKFDLLIASLDCIKFSFVLDYIPKIDIKDILIERIDYFNHNINIPDNDIKMITCEAIKLYQMQLLNDYKELDNLATTVTENSTVQMFIQLFKSDGTPITWYSNHTLFDNFIIMKYSVMPDELYNELLGMNLYMTKNITIRMRPELSSCSLFDNQIFDPVRNLAKLDTINMKVTVLEIRELPPEFEITNSIIQQITSFKTVDEYFEYFCSYYNFIRNFQPLNGKAIFIAARELINDVHYQIPIEKEYGDYFLHEFTSQLDHKSLKFLSESPEFHEFDYKQFVSDMKSVQPHKFNANNYINIIISNIQADITLTQFLIESIINDTLLAIANTALQHKRIPTKSDLTALNQIFSELIEEFIYHSEHLDSFNKINGHLEELKDAISLCKTDDTDKISIRIGKKTREKIDRIFDKEEIVFDYDNFKNTKLYSAIENINKLGFLSFNLKSLISSDSEESQKFNFAQVRAYLIDLIK